MNTCVVASFIKRLIPVDVPESTYELAAESLKVINDMPNPCCDKEAQNL